MMATALSGDTSSIDSNNAGKRLQMGQIEFRASLDLNDDSNSLTGSTLTLTTTKHKISSINHNSSNNTLDQASLKENMSANEAVGQIDQQQQQQFPSPPRRVARHHFKDMSSKTANGRNETTAAANTQNQNQQQHRHHHKQQQPKSFDFDDLESADLISNNNNSSIKSGGGGVHQIRSGIGSGNGGGTGGETFVPILVLAKNKSLRSSRGDTDRMFASNNAKLNYIKQLQQSELRNLRNFQYLKRYNSSNNYGSDAANSTTTNADNISNKSFDNDSNEDLMGSGKKNSSADVVDAKQVLINN
jgi:hypothetical protein